jgi:hypothetical protein
VLLRLTDRDFSRRLADLANKGAIWLDMSALATQLVPDGAVHIARVGRFSFFHRDGI